MPKTTRTPTKELIPVLNQIEDKVKELRVIVDNMPDSSAKDAMEYFVVNGEKKLEKFLSVQTELTDEQKKAIALIKSGKINPKTVLSTVQDGETKKPKKSIK